MVLWILTLFATLIYASLVLYFLVGLLRLRNVNIGFPHCEGVSVVVAVRNERQNVDRLVNSLLAQDCGDFEVIIVDDYSDDGTWEDLQGYADRRLRVIRSTALPGKKYALSEGVRRAKNDLIVVTDADCVHPTGWLGLMTGRLQASQTDVVIGNVSVSYSSLLSWAALQALEFSSLQASGLGSAMMGRPFMANGANMSFRKRLWQEANLRTDHASGDDVFLLHWAVKRGYNVSVCAAAGAGVMTEAQPTLRDFVNQRIRWAAKASDYQDNWARFVAIIVFLENVILLVSLFFATRVFVFAFLVKAIVDMALLWVYLGRYSRRKLLVWFLFEEILYIFYAVIIGLLSQVRGFEWKGRRYRK